MLFQTLKVPGLSLSRVAGFVLNFVCRAEGWKLSLSVFRDEKPSGCAVAAFGLCNLNP